MSKHKVENIKELRKHKAWIPEDNVIAKSAMNAFAIPAIPLTIGDVLIGLQTGLVDIVTASPIGALALQWHTQVKYLIDLPVSYIFGVFIVDKKSLHKVSLTDQKIVKTILGETLKNINEKNRINNILGLQALYNQGIQKIHFSENNVTDFKELTQDANKELISNSKMTPSLVTELNYHLEKFRISTTNKLSIANSSTNRKN